MKKIAEIFQISVVELLGIENHTNEQIVADVTHLSQKEKERMLRNIYNRGWLTVLLSGFVWGCLIYVSKILADNNLYGLPQIATAGMSGFMGILIANGCVSIWNGRKLRRDLA